MTLDLQLTRLRLAVVAAALVVAAPAAHAFEIDSTTMTNSDGTAKFSDPDEDLDGLATGMTATGQDGKLHFGNDGASSGSVRPRSVYPMQDQGTIAGSRSR